MRRSFFGFVCFVLFFGIAQGAEEKRTVAAIVFLTDQEFFQLVQAGYRDRAKEVGMHLVQASSKLDLHSESWLIDRYIRMGVDAIILSPFHQQRSVPAIRRAHDAGVKVVISSVPLAAAFPVTTVTSRDVDLGKMAGDAAAAYIAREKVGRPRIAILDFDDREPVQSGQRVDGFLQAVSPTPADVVVARENGWSPEMAMAVTAKLLAKQKDINMIFAANEGGTAGAVMAVKHAGKGDSVTVFGIDSNRQIASMLLSEDGILQAVAVQQPYEIAKKTIDLTVAVLDGKTVPQKVVVPGFLLTRKDPVAVRRYQTYLQEILPTGEASVKRTPDVPLH